VPQMVRIRQAHYYFPGSHMPNIRTPELSQRQQNDIDIRVEAGLKRIVNAYSHLMQSDAAAAMTPDEEATLQNNVRDSFLANS